MLGSSISYVFVLVEEEEGRPKGRALMVVGGAKRYSKPSVLEEEAEEEGVEKVEEPLTHSSSSDWRRSSVNPPLMPPEATSEA